LAFLKEEIKEMILLLARHNITSDFAGMGDVFNDPKLKRATEYHICNIAQLLKDYKEYFISDNVNYNRTLVNLDTFYGSCEQGFHEFIVVRNHSTKMSLILK
jgi:hypothetical protein